MNEIDWIKTVWTLARERLQQVRSRSQGQGGWSVVEVVVIIGIMVAAAIIVGGILVAKARDKANSIQMQ